MTTRFMQTKHIVFSFTNKLFLVLITLILLLHFFVSNAQATEKIPVKVLIVTFFNIGDESGDKFGESHLWIERLKLDTTFDFPLGYDKLHYNKENQILQMTTGQGNINATASMMALGLDKRFDLSKSYILMVGIGGGDPRVISVGSAVWSDYVIDGDLKHAIDPREMPKDWSYGTFPYMGSKPNEKPVKYLGTDFFQINPKLLKLAYSLSKDVKIPDNENIQKRRALYKGYVEAQRPPFVAIGSNIAASEYWHGELKTKWARNWVKYLTKGKGTFYTTAMEDSGVLSAIDKLNRKKLMDKNRVVSLRTVSNYSMQWSDVSAYESFMGEIDGYSGLSASTEAAYLVGSPFVLHIINNWDKFK